MKIVNSSLIKESLIKACIKSRPSYFKSYLASEKVTCKSDKEGFYKFFKYMLAVSKRQSVGELHFKIKRTGLKFNYESRTLNDRYYFFF